MPVKQTQDDINIQLSNKLDNAIERLARIELALNSLKQSVNTSESSINFAGITTLMINNQNEMRLMVSQIGGLA